MIINVNGLAYEAVPELEKHSCRGCMFETDYGDRRCTAASMAYDCTTHKVVFKLAPGVVEPKPMPVGDTKPTNPKDLIGVRKPPLSVIPQGVLFELGLALLEGASKYGRHNYRGVGVRASVYFDAAQGHLSDWWEGDDIDEESDLSHVTKAIASLVVLRDAMLQGMLTDDRPPRSKVFKRHFAKLAGEIIDRHKDKSPYHYTIADTPSNHTVNEVPR